MTFNIPTSFPVVLENLNWTPITLGITLLAVLVGWFLPRYGAALWYRGKMDTLRDDSAVCHFPALQFKALPQLLDYGLLI